MSLFRSCHTGCCRGCFCSWLERAEATRASIQSGWLSPCLSAFTVVRVEFNPRITIYILFFFLNLTLRESKVEEAHFFQAANSNLITDAGTIQYRTALCWLVGSPRSPSIWGDQSWSIWIDKKCGTLCSPPAGRCAALLRFAFTWPQLAFHSISEPEAEEESLDVDRQAKAVRTDPICSCASQELSRLPCNLRGPSHSLQGEKKQPVMGGVVPGRGLPEYSLFLLAQPHLTPSHILAIRRTRMSLQQHQSSRIRSISLVLCMGC